MTIFESIKSKNIDELAEWLDEYGLYDGSPWIDWWDKKYCCKCIPELKHNEIFGNEDEYGWCELHKKCKYFQDMDNIPNNKQIIKMWLENEDYNYGTDY